MRKNRGNIYKVKCSRWPSSKISYTMFPLRWKMSPLLASHTTSNTLKDPVPCMSWWMGPSAMHQWIPSLHLQIQCVFHPSQTRPCVSLHYWCCWISGVPICRRGPLLKIIVNDIEGQCEATQHAPEFFQCFQITPMVEGLVVLQKTASLVAMHANAECYEDTEVSGSNFTERQWPPLRF